MDRLLFVTASGDANGEVALEVLKSLGEETQVLTPGEVSPQDCIALFTPSQARFSGSTGKFLRCSAVKLEALKLVPEWVATPFTVAVVRTEKQQRVLRPGVKARKRYYGDAFKESLRNMVRSYKQWLTVNGNGGVHLPNGRALVPWSAYENDPNIGIDSVCYKRAIEWRERPAVCNIQLLIKKTDDYVRVVEVGRWKVNYTDREIVFPGSAVEQATTMLNKWALCFPEEQTWSRQQLGVPSLFVRLDCIVQHGQLIVYEVEERPAGMGISSMVNPDFLARLKGAAQNWPEFGVVVSPLRKATDDHLWLSALDRPNRADGLVVVRAEPEEKQFHCFEAQSVSSLKSKGDKSYGESLGWWQRVTVDTQLPWSQCFVLKPLQGSKLRNLEIWDPNKRPGSSVKEKVQTTLKEQGEMFFQLLYDPMDTGLERFPWMIFRVFFGYDPVRKQWNCLGGNWNARKNLRIHGASDAIFGPAVIE